LGITELSAARPVQAALSSAASFTIGAAVPLLAAIVADRSWRVAAIAVTALVCLAVLGVVSARVGNAPAGRAVARITVLSTVAMAVTALIGVLVGTVT
jgi:VIT1/CCC1 family predicted Fe2+/Mn2+ transporter